MNSVSYLIANWFVKQKLEDQLEIKRLGRPLPVLNICQPNSSKTRVSFRRFNESIYLKADWLCGCEDRNALFCFPCLLFSDKTHDLNWVKTGVKDLKHFAEKMKTHNLSIRHKNNCMDLGIFGNVNIMTQLDDGYRLSIKQHNEGVKRNRHALNRIINCVKFCGIFDLALRGPYESDDAINPGIFRGLINFSSDLDEVLKDHLNTATVFEGSSKLVQNDIIDCMLRVCRELITQQIKDAPFLSIMADETTDVTTHCQMVIIFRYVLDGRAVERFWGFVNPPKSTADGFTEAILIEMEPHLREDPLKLIAQSYGGGAVMTACEDGVQAKIKRLYSNAHFVHCYAHELNLLIEKATSEIPKVRVFFANLSSIPKFFSNSSNRSDVSKNFTIILYNKELQAIQTSWNYNIRTVKTVFELRNKLIECFNLIENSTKQLSTMHEASVLRRILQDPSFLFWLKTFYKIMPHVDILYKLQHRHTDPVKIQSAIQDFQNAISREREDLDNIDVSEEVGVPAAKIPKQEPNAEEDSSLISAKEVCDVITSQVYDIFCFTNHLQAANLLDSSLFPEYANTFPERDFKAALAAYPMLEEDKLRSELTVLYKRLDFFEAKGVLPILQCFLKNNLTSPFGEIYKLLCIIVTTPMPTAEAERCFSVLKSTKTFLQNSMKQERLTALAMISIEKELIKETVDFNERVIENFVLLDNRRTEFLYK